MSGTADVLKGHYPYQVKIDAYGKGGFRFAEMSHIGSLLCLPSGMYAWEPEKLDDLTPQAFEKAIADSQDFEVLFIGCGPDIAGLPELKAYLKEQDIRAEVMATGAALRTYNVLMSEERKVAAALIAV